MQKWEYRCHYIDLYRDPEDIGTDLLKDINFVLPDGTPKFQQWYQHQLEEQLNRLGQEGWEIVAATPEILMGDSNIGSFLMKRPLCKATLEKPSDTYANSTADSENIALLLDPDTPIRDLPFSSRACNCLHRGDIDTLGQLIHCYERDILKLRNMGGETLHNIKTVLASYGLSLRDERKLPLGPIREEN